MGTMIPQIKKRKYSFTSVLNYDIFSSTFRPKFAKMPLFCQYFGLGYDFSGLAMKILGAWFWHNVFGRSENLDFIMRALEKDHLTKHDIKKESV